MDLPRKTSMLLWMVSASQYSPRWPVVASMKWQTSTKKSSSLLLTRRIKRRKQNKKGRWIFLLIYFCVLAWLPIDVLSCMEQDSYQKLTKNVALLKQPSVSYHVLLGSQVFLWSALPSGVQCRVHGEMYHGLYSRCVQSWSAVNLHVCLPKSNRTLEFCVY